MTEGVLIAVCSSTGSLILYILSCSRLWLHLVTGLFINHDINYINMQTAP